MGSTKHSSFDQQLKLSKPVVSTAVGAEGLPVHNGVELLLADRPEQFAEAVVRVLTDQALAQQLGARAANTVRSQFGWGRVAASFAEICQRAIRKREFGGAGATVAKELSAAR